VGRIEIPRTLVDDENRAIVVGTFTKSFGEDAGVGSGVLGEAAVKAVAGGKPFTSLEIEVDKRLVGLSFVRDGVETLSGVLANCVTIDWLVVTARD